MDINSNVRAVLATILVASISACGGGGSAGTTPTPPDDQLKPTPQSALLLKRSQSCDELKDYVADSIADLLLDTGYVDCIACTQTTAGTPGAAPGLAATADTFESFTGTNNQEAGVDELDLVEADASGNLYTIDGQYVVVANGLPPEDLREVGQVKVIENGFINGLLLDSASNRLVVSTSVFGIDPAQVSIVGPEFWFTPQSELHFYDISDPTNPTLIRKMLTDGFEIAVRRIGSRVHLITHFLPNMPLQIFEDEDLTALREQYAQAVSDKNDDDIAALAEQIRARVTAIVETHDAQEFLPGLWSQDQGADYVNIPNPNCTVDMPDVSMQYALTSVTSVDTDGGNIATTAITNNAWSIYASNDNLYLIQPSIGWWWDPLQRQETAIYKYAIGAGQADYRAFGTVKGIAFDSFQLSEHDGFLRVATHRNEQQPMSPNRSVDNNLYVLSDDGGGNLGLTGAVEGFGANETIFSARFLGDRGFVVTFRRIDPLFAFDLSDPADPRLMGELEIPGVTTYMHPLGENHLLTIGFSGDNQGLNPGYQLQIFDVQDLATPMLIHSLSPEFDADGFAWTRASWDHLAFNYFPEGGVLTIPVQYWSDVFEQHFSGFAAYSVDVGQGIAELGRLDHSDLAKDVYCPVPSDADDGSICELGTYLQAADPRRSVSASVAGETVIYTFSDVGIKASAASDFETELAALPLMYPNNYWWWIAF